MVYIDVFHLIRELYFKFIIALVFIEIRSIMILLTCWGSTCGMYDEFHQYKIKNFLLTKLYLEKVLNMVLLKRLLLSNKKLEKVYIVYYTT